VGEGEESVPLPKNTPRKEGRFLPTLGGGETGPGEEKIFAEKRKELPEGEMAFLFTRGKEVAPHGATGREEGFGEDHRAGGEKGTRRGLAFRS